VSRYTSTTDADRETMLAKIGVASIDELFARQIPDALAVKTDMKLAPGAGEQEVYEHLRALAARNVSNEDEISFLGAGMYDHYVPAIVDMLLSRSEFLTPYTPYQPEISQGGLQVMFEYQTAISELTALPVSNASVYDGPSAVAAAGYLALLASNSAPGTSAGDQRPGGWTPGRRRKKFVVSRGLHPHAIETLQTYSQGYNVDVVVIDLVDGVTDPDAWAAAIDDDTSAGFLAQPNFLGAIEDVEALTKPAKDAGALAIASVDPMTLSVLKPPGECGVDVAVGEGQSLGNRLDFGGPSFGFFAATQEQLRRMPGRIAGETTDAKGRRGFVLTLQTREQHIRREKATSNICTAQALNALAGLVHLAWLGKEGFQELGELLVQRTHYARETLCTINGVSKLHAQPVVREFALELDVAGIDGVKRVIELCQSRGVNPGLALGTVDDKLPTGLLVAITEQRTREQIDQLAETLKWALDEVGAGTKEVAHA
jgi:glycine dehydrogenase subunit 1